MNFFKWLTRRNSVHDEVLSLYKRGLACAIKHDQKEARGAFTAAIDRRNAPADLRAMALYNRAMLFGAANEIRKATQDLNAVLAMTAAPHKVKLAARQKLDRMHRRNYIDTAPGSMRVHPADRSISAAAGSKALRYQQSEYIQ
jgi:hypothetical protein